METLDASYLVTFIGSLEYPSSNPSSNPIKEQIALGFQPEALNHPLNPKPQSPLRSGHARTDFAHISAG